jgi:serine/threonine-protein kinase
MDAAKGVVARFDIAPFKPPACVVPKVVGKRLAVAKKAIKARHCSVGRITKVRSKRLKAGLVVSESPSPGKRLKNGAKVSLRVSRGKK